MTLRADNRISLPIRVYLEDTDAQGVVYNASYFRFMERARTECLRVKGVDHVELQRTHGVNLVLSKIEARFIAPARLSDMLVVTAEMTGVSGARMRFEQTVHRDDENGELLCDGVAQVACVDVEANRPKRFPKTLISEWM